MRDRLNERHRAVASASAGRRLGPGEVVHHENELKTDNSATNLKPMARGAHTAEHNRHRALSKLRAALRMTQERKKLY